MKFFIIIKENSERLPNKNFLRLGGLPLYEHLLRELSTEDVYIDTDSSDLLNRFKDENNITCYQRDANHIALETDKEFKVSPALLMIEKFLNKYVRDENELIVTPHITSPFISLKTILKASKSIGQYDSICACTEHQEFAYFQGKAVNFDPTLIAKTQDLEPIVMGNGAFFIFTKKEFMKHKNRTGANNLFYPISFPESIEIDTIKDFKLAELYYNAKQTTDYRRDAERWRFHV